MSEAAQRRFAPADDVLAIEPDALDRAWSICFDDEELPENETEGDLSIVEIRGPLESRAGWWWDGYAGRGGIVDRIKSAMLDANTRAVVLVMASPGGACAGLFEALDELRPVCTKPIVAFSEGGCFSAAYALSTLADRVLVSRASGVGSIGVIATMVSYADALKKEGVAVAVIASGSQKTDGHPAVEITDAAKTRMRTRVNELATMFADEVAPARKMTREAVLGLQAGVFYGPAAVDAGLADEVGTIARAKQLARELAASTAEGQTMKNVREKLGMKAEASDAEVASRLEALLETEAALHEATGENSATKALVTLKAWKRDAATASADRKRAEEAEAAARASHIDDVMAAQGLPASMRPLLERDAKRDFAAFQNDFPRPTRAELEERAKDAKRTERLPGASAGSRKVNDTVGDAEPTDEELAEVRLTRDEWRAANSRNAKGGK